MTNYSKECAFCPSTGKMSAEHIVSDWITKLFPGPITAQFKNSSGERPLPFKVKKIDWTTRVVCKKCNETWMSNIEGSHAKQSMTELIKGNGPIPISRSRARSISIFAFKTAVILDHAYRGKIPFFSKRSREAFRLHLNIPPNVQMWMCGYAGHRRGVHIKAVYHSANLTPTYPLQLYVCTCAFGNFAFQVVSAKHMGLVDLIPLPGFENLAVPLWPKSPPNFIWPLTANLRNVDDFESFADRWESVAPSRPLG